ncbi:MAG: Rieske 2Fe-2S domain-containing protein, partial [Chlamydiia bacterium]|nr:Rieske 2Fe-2S domain-containing protein [Chlamydiia bacterium]
MASKMLKLISLDAIPEGGSLIVAGPRGTEIALFKIKGAVYALDNACPHSEGPLGKGELNS